MVMADLNSLPCVFLLFYTTNLVLTLTSYCQLPVPVSSAASAHALVSVSAYARKDFPGRWDTVGQGRTKSGSTIQIKARSKLDCLRHCVQTPDCRAFTYHSEDRNCRSYREEFTKISRSAIKQGWSYLFVIKGRKSGKPRNHEGEEAKPQNSQEPHKSRESKKQETGETGRQNSQDYGKSREPKNQEIEEESRGQTSQEPSRSEDPKNREAATTKLQNTQEPRDRIPKKLDNSCPVARGYVFFNQSSLCIRLYKENLDYYDAILSCVADDGRLVRIDSALKQREIFRYLGSVGDKGKFWIQGTFKNNKWEYSDDEESPMTFMHLAKPQPPLPDVGIRLAIAKEDGFWHATPEGEQLPYICEISPTEKS